MYKPNFGTGWVFQNSCPLLPSSIESLLIISCKLRAVSTVGSLPPAPSPMEKCYDMRFLLTPLIFISHRAIPMIAFPWVQTIYIYIFFFLYKQIYMHMFVHIRVVYVRKLCYSRGSVN